MTRFHRPNITRGFELNKIQFLRKLGQGMTGSVRQIFFIFSKKFLIKQKKTVGQGGKSKILGMHTALVLQIMFEILVKYGEVLLFSPNSRHNNVNVTLQTRVCRV
jgi:hypothetical protein